MKSLISNLLIPCLLFIQACSGSKTVQQPPSRKIYSKIPLQNLLDSIGTYQNRRIETLGYYVCGFEHTCIQPELAYQPFPDRKLYDWTQRIWVETKGSRSFSCDSVDKRVVVIRGILDTSSHGHMGEYTATIKHAVIEVR